MYAAQTSTHCSKVATVVFGELSAREPIGDVRQPTGSAVAKLPYTAPGVDGVAEGGVVTVVDIGCWDDTDTLEAGGTTSSLGMAPKLTGLQPDGACVKYIQILDPAKQKLA